MKQDALSLAIQNAATEEIIFSKSEVPVDSAWESHQDWLDECFWEGIQIAKQASVSNCIIFFKFPVQVDALPPSHRPEYQEPQTTAGRDQNEEKESSPGWFFWLVQHVILLFLILGLAMWQYHGFSLDSIPEEHHGALTLLFAIMAIVLGSLGIYFGERERITVFTSTFDIVLTGLAIFTTMFYYADFTDPTSAGAFQFFSIGLNAWVVLLSFRANNSLLKMLLVTPAKVSCIAILLTLALLSAAYARSALEEVIENKNYGEAARMAGISAAAGAGFVSLTRFLKSLIKKSKQVH